MNGREHVEAWLANMSDDERAELERRGKESAERCVREFERGVQQIIFDEERQLRMLAELDIKPPQPVYLIVNSADTESGQRTPKVDTEKKSTKFPCPQKTEIVAFCQDFAKREGKEPDLDICRDLADGDEVKAKRWQRYISRYREYIDIHKSRQ